MLVALIVCLPLTRQVETATAGSSSVLYLAMAMNDAFCGRYATLQTTMSLGNGFSVAVDGERPIKEHMVEHSGSIERYCASTFQPYVVNEISLGILEGYLLRVMPNLNLSQLATVLAVLRVALIGFFGFALLRAGASVLFTFFACLGAHYLTVLLGGDAVFSQYPFLLPVMLAFVAGCATLVAWLTEEKRMRALILAGILGVAGAFAGNFRTTLFPMIAATFALALFDYLRRGGFALRRWVTALALVVAFVAAAFAFDRAYISPMRRVVGIANYPSHTLAHPLVLGLAKPPSDLAAREGIEWNDAVGTRLAQRIDPTASYLNETYEAALLTYYVKLWIYYPKEMARLYLEKWRVTGPLALENLWSRSGGTFWPSKNGLAFAVAVMPVAAASRVVGLAQVLLAITIAAVIWSPRMNPRAALLLTALPGIAFLGYIEAAVVLTGTTLWYNGVLLAVIVFAGLLGYQAIIDLSTSVLTTSRMRLSAKLQS